MISAPNSVKNAKIWVYLFLLYWRVCWANNRGRYPSTLLIRTILAYNPFTKIFQNFKTYFLTTFNTFLMKTAWFWNLYFKLLLIKLFVPILALSRFELNGYSPVSVLSREAPTSLECGYGYNYDTLFNNCDTLFVNKKDFHSC